MAKYRIPITTWASGTIEFETEETDPEAIYEAAMNSSATELPSVCAQCGGWGRSFSLEVGDEWEPVTDREGVVEVTKIQD